MRIPKRGLVAALVATAAVQAGAASASTTVVFRFTRGSSNTTSSLTMLQQDQSTGRVFQRGDWRAGSGYLKNECKIGAGWLPAGSYSITLHSDSYPGTKIQGRVWELSDKACAGGAGVLRTQLFIHSEETSSRGQSCGPAGSDYPFCWEGPHDYYSSGCIKLNHFVDLPAVDSDWHAWGGTVGANRLYVS
jgi:hypothetical protein